MMMHTLPHHYVNHIHVLFLKKGPNETLLIVTKRCLHQTFIDNPYSLWIVIIKTR